MTPNLYDAGNAARQTLLADPLRIRHVAKYPTAVWLTHPAGFYWLREASYMSATHTRKPKDSKMRYIVGYTPAVKLGHRVYEGKYWWSGRHDYSNYANTKRVPIEAVTFVNDLSEYYSRKSQRPAADKV